jgi:hypothetical protein
LPNGTNFDSTPTSDIELQENWPKLKTERKVLSYLKAQKAQKQGGTFSFACYVDAF